MKVLMIANPNSTSQSPALFTSIIPTLMKVPDLHLLSKFTHYAGHAEEMCRAIVADPESDIDAVLVLGGDGTVNEVVNGLLGPADQPTPAHRIPTLAVVPTGSANVFARALGFPADAESAVEALAETLAGNLTRDITLGKWDDRWFAVNAGFGVDAEVIAGVERARSYGFAASPLVYLNVSVRAWMRARREPPQISLKARTREGEVVACEDIPLCVASNTNPWTFLGPLPVVTNPRNSFDRNLGIFGLSDISGIKGAAGMLHLIGFGYRRFFGQWIRQNMIRVDDVVEVTLSCHEPRRFQVDGESVGVHQSVVLRSVPAALRVFAPTVAHRKPFSRRPWQVLRDLVRIR